MNSEEKTVFSRLLSVDELAKLYDRLGDSIRNKIDLQNFSSDYEAVHNALHLLVENGFASVDTVTSAFRKNKSLDPQSFIESFTRVLRKRYKNEMGMIFASETKYDEDKSRFFIVRNSIPIELSGLVMLLGGLGVFKIHKDRVYLTSATDAVGDKVRARINNGVSAVELKKQLVLLDELGEEAEQAAMEYERELLRSLHISCQPIKVSEIDVSAGYDIASYSRNNSKKPDKFIEVKSCRDEKLEFFISQNEIRVAKQKTDSYYLYLFNRKTKKFLTICNPYETVLHGQGWATETQVLKVCSISSGEHNCPS